MRDYPVRGLPENASEDERYRKRCYGLDHDYSLLTGAFGLSAKLTRPTDGNPGYFLAPWKEGHLACVFYPYHDTQAGRGNIALVAAEIPTELSTQFSPVQVFLRLCALPLEDIAKRLQDRKILKERPEQLDLPEQGASTMILPEALNGLAWPGADEAFLVIDGQAQAYKRIAQAPKAPEPEVAPYSAPKPKNKTPLIAAAVAAVAVAGVALWGMGVFDGGKTPPTPVKNEAPAPEVSSKVPAAPKADDAKKRAEDARKKRVEKIISALKKAAPEGRLAAAYLSEKGILGAHLTLGEPLGLPAALPEKELDLVQLENGDFLMTVADAENELKKLFAPAESAFKDQVGSAQSDEFGLNVKADEWEERTKNLFTAFQWQQTESATLDESAVNEKLAQWKGTGAYLVFLFKSPRAEAESVYTVVCVDSEGAGAEKMYYLNGAQVFAHDRTGAWLGERLTLKNVEAVRRTPAIFSERRGLKGRQWIVKIAPDRAAGFAGLSSAEKVNMLVHDLAESLPWK